MATVNVNTPLLSGKPTAGSRHKPRMFYIMMFSIAVGAVGLLFLFVDNQQGDVLNTFLRNASTSADTNHLAPVSDETKAVEVSSTASTEEVDKVGSDDGEGIKLDSTASASEMIVEESPPPHQRNVRFIPYPHRTLGSGDSIQCQWETYTNTPSSTLDFTQQNAYSEGVCIPPSLNNTIHIFSSAEAIECLSPEIQQHDIRVILAGDSYMKQMYIGLADILLSKHIRDDKEIYDNVQRSKMLSIAQTLLSQRREHNSTFPSVQYRCEEECYGQELLDECAKCIDQVSGDSDSVDVWVVGVGIHIYERVKNHASDTLQEIENFLDTKEVQNRTIYVSPPAGNMDRVYRDLLPNVAPENPSQPFLDVFQMTKSCTMDNCISSGGHRTRYVNRWKAQLLLNTLCEVQQ